jgi:hypothetical protein
MRRKRLTLLAALVGGLVVPVVAAPSASASVSGSITFHCTARLPEWPSPGANGTCGNDATPAVAYAALSGTDDEGNPYVVQGNGSFSAAFDYTAHCVVGGPPVLGQAQGVALVTGVPAFHRGQLTTASVHAVFTWNRVGADAIILVSDWTITFGNGGTADGTTGIGDAAFVPLASLNNSCPVGGPLKALVQGDVDAVT